MESTPKWGAQVVYGDTDSIFVLLPGKSREEAFTVGEEIADAVTAANPPPVKLKFEKILHPAILQVKIIKNYPTKKMKNNECMNIIVYNICKGRNRHPIKFIIVSDKKTILRIHV